MQKGKILALDIGKSKVGVAVSDQARQMAFGRGIMSAVPREELFKKLAKMVANENIALLLVGLPFGAGKEETPQTVGIRAWADEFMAYLMDLKQVVELEFIDESFSTFEANKILGEAGIKMKEGKRLEDEMAAVVLIHRYIDFRP